MLKVGMIIYFRLVGSGQQWRTGKVIAVPIGCCAKVKQIKPKPNCKPWHQARTITLRPRVYEWVEATEMAGLIYGD